MGILAVQALVGAFVDGARSRIVRMALAEGDEPTHGLEQFYGIHREKKSGAGNRFAEQPRLRAGANKTAERDEAPRSAWVSEYAVPLRIWGERIEAEERAARLRLVTGRRSLPTDQ